MDLILTDQKATGSHYTPTELADFVARQIAEQCPSGPLSVLDPACGDGELLYAFSLKRPESKLTGFDMNASAIIAARERLEALFQCGDFLDISLPYLRGESLFESPEKYDVVIANPPYIRTQVLGAKRAQELARVFQLKGRVDIYFAFLEGIAAVLKDGGIAGVIVSNRFMTTRAGEVVRTRILENFDVIHIWDLGDTKLFEAAVLPAVLLLRKKSRQSASKPRMTTVYTCSGSPDRNVESPLLGLDESGLISAGGVTFEVKCGLLNTQAGTWRVATESGDKWLDTVRAHTHMTFGDIGNIRVGIKTTADKIFVKEKWPEPRPETILPLISNDAARRYRSLPADLEVLYTHEEVGGKRTPISLENYPIARAYLEANREALSSRKYVIEANRQWFEIWVPHQPALWKRLKLVFPDISEKPVFWMSTEREAIHGDCYWLCAADLCDEDILWLAMAVGNSKFIEEFYDHSFNNKLYAGRRRFMTQYVEKFPLPNPQSTLAKEIIRLAKEIYRKTPSEEADRMAEELEKKIPSAFGL